MADINLLMDQCFNIGASDLHLSVGRVPVPRVLGRLVEHPEGVAQVVVLDLPGQRRRGVLGLLHEVVGQAEPLVKRAHEEVGREGEGYQRREQ